MEPTSTSAPNNDPNAQSNQSGSEYLADQISDARLALESTLDDLALDISGAANVRRWVRRYPWAALGTALVAGFTLAHVLTKRRHDSAESKVELPKPMHETTIPAGTRTTGWRSAGLTALFDLLRLVVTQIIAAAVRQAATHASDGQHTGASASSETASEPINDEPERAATHPDASL
jgi:hypothetical protein